MINLNASVREKRTGHSEGQEAFWHLALGPWSLWGFPQPLSERAAEPTHRFPEPLWLALCWPQGVGRACRAQDRALFLGVRHWKAFLSYLQQRGTAGKSLYLVHLAAGKGSRDKVCLWYWALFSPQALCLDPVPQHHWWRCKCKSRSADTSQGWVA